MPSSKYKVPGIKQLKKLLDESTFNPKNPGPMSVVVALNDPSYCETKAVELVMEAKKSLTGIPSLFIYHDKLIQAISLLALARAMRRNSSGSDETGEAQAGT